MKWFYREWWNYLLEPIHYSSSWPRSIWCRLRGHPEGPVYYTHSAATEPDWKCKNCGDYIG